jgi:hypothetical protein
LLDYFLEHALPSSSDGPARRRSSASSIARSIDVWGVPIGGQRIVDYDDRDFEYSRDVPTPDP